MTDADKCAFLLRGGRELHQAVPAGNASWCRLCGVLLYAFGRLDVPDYLYTYGSRTKENLDGVVFHVRRPLRWCDE
jgi:hypothetical protein